MVKRIKSSDVLDPNAMTNIALSGRVIGRFRPTGPNRWDDWELDRSEIGQTVEVPIDNKVQLEPLGADPEVRFRWREGRSSVLLLSWLPSEQDKEALSTGQWGIQEAEQATFVEKVLGIGPKDDPRDDMLEYVLEVLTTPYSADPGMGWEAMLVRKLQGK